MVWIYTSQKVIHNKQSLKYIGRDSHNLNNSINKMKVINSLQIKNIKYISIYEVGTKISFLKSIRSKY